MILIRQFRLLSLTAVCAVGIFVAAGRVQAQSEADSDTTIILLSDIAIQLECTQALNDLYNFKFDAAEEQFRYLK